MRCVFAAVLALAMLLAASPVHSADYYVARNNPAPNAPYTSWVDAATNIQDAINVAPTGSTVWVAPGIYTTPAIPGTYDGDANVVDIRKGLTLRSSNGVPAETVIDGAGQCRGVYPYPGSGERIVLEGFTIRNCRATNGAAIFLRAENSRTVEVVNCVIRDNTAHAGGGVMVWQPNDNARSLHYLFSNCVFQSNHATNGTGGVLFDAVRAGGGKRERIIDCVMVSNTCSGAGNTGAAGVFLNSPTDGLIANCRFTHNEVGIGDSGRAGAVYHRSGNLTLRNCLVTENRGTWAGGVYVSKNAETILQNCTIADNAAAGVRAQEPENNIGFVNTVVYGDSIYDRGTQSFTNCCLDPSILHAAGVNLMTGDPRFADPVSGDYRLDHGSPCIDAGTNESWMAGTRDLVGAPRVYTNLVDIGCYEYRDIAAIDNAGGATNVLADSAWLNGTLTATGSLPTGVSMFWGRSDGGTNLSSWDRTNHLGVRSTGGFSAWVTNLAIDAEYFYRCCATNRAGRYWADDTAVFHTPLPVVDIHNGDGAAAIAAHSAWVQGVLTNTVGVPTTVRIHWGPGDGGTTVVSWVHTTNLGVRATGLFAVRITGLESNATYHYRCSATNAGGVYWASSTTNFTTAPCKLVHDGTPMAEIVITTNAPRMVALAALELQYYIEKISGARLPITTDPGQAPAVRIYVGQSEHTDRLGVTAAGLAHGAFRMVSGEDWLVLLGPDYDFEPVEPWARGTSDRERALAEWDVLTIQEADRTWSHLFASTYKGWWNPGDYDAFMCARYGLDNQSIWDPRDLEYSREYQGPGMGAGFWEQDQGGSLNAVYEFLRRLGARWHMPGPLGELLPEEESLALPPVSDTLEPDYDMRSWNWYNYSGFSFDDTMWARRLAMNGCYETLGRTGYAHGHTAVHAREAMKVAHPEYYALIDGVRDTTYRDHGRACFSSQGMRDETVRYARFLFDDYGLPHVSIWPGDGFRKCECAECALKSASELVWEFVDQVARELYATHPDRLVSCGAYTPYKLPPDTVDQFPSNVVVFISNWRRPVLDDPDKWTSYWACVEGWMERVATQHVMRVENNLYSLSGDPVPFPMIHPRAMALDLHALKGISRGDCGEESQEGGAWKAIGCDHLTLYAQARFLWDADQDIDALLEEYYTRFYGPACEEMQAAIEFAEASYSRTDTSGNGGRCVPQNVEHSVKVELLERLLVARAAAGDTVYGERIQTLIDELPSMEELCPWLVPPVEYYVAWNNPTPVFPFTNGWSAAATNIQDAIDVAASNSIVWIAPGRYTVPTNPGVYEGVTNVVDVRKALTLRSSNGVPADTVIDGDGRYRGAFLSPDSTWRKQVVLDGLTIENGWATNGGGLFLYAGNGCTTVVQNCVIRRNTAVSGGGGIGVGPQEFRSFTFTLSNCLVEGNQVTNGSGGGLSSVVRTSDAYGTFVECVVVSNTSSSHAAGFYLSASPHARFDRCVFSYNRTEGSGRGGGLYLRGDETTLRNCLIHDNRGDWGGGVYLSKNNVTTFENCTVVSNSGGSGSGISIQEPENELWLFNTIVYGDSILDRAVQAYDHCCLDPVITHAVGDGNIRLDPLFVDGPARNFRLQRVSPCRNSGTNRPWMTGERDLDGVVRIGYRVVDRGCYESGAVGTLFLFK